MKFAQYWLARMGGYMNEAESEGTPSTGNDFNPTTIEQGEGLLDRSAAEDLERQQEENGGAEIQSDTSESTDETNNPDEAETETPTETVDDSTPTVYTYNGVEVEVENSPEVVEAFTAKAEALGGVTIDSVNKELFSEEGLTTETKSKLDEAFGKPVVDMYLQGWKAQQDANMVQAEVFETQYNHMAEEATGGNLTAVLSWANDNLKPEEYQSYQRMVNSGDMDTARLALSDLTRRSGLTAQETETEQPTKPTLIKPTNTGTTTEDGPISAAEYHAAIASGDYYKNTSFWDARRLAGQQQGL